VDTSNGVGKLAFSDTWYESIRQAHVLCEVYQAVKRANRDNSTSAQVYMVTNERDVIDGLVAQMQRIQRTLPIPLEGVTVNEQEKRAYTKVDELAEWLVRVKAGDPVSSCKKGEWSCKKKTLCTLLDIDPTNLAGHLKRDEILQLEHSGRIRIDKQGVSIVLCNFLRRFLVEIRFQSILEMYCKLAQDFSPIMHAHRPLSCHFHRR